MPMLAKLLKKVGPEPSKAGVGSASKRGAPMKRQSTLARKTPLMEAQLPEVWEDDDYDIADLLGTYRDNAASSDDDGQYLARRSFVDKEEDGAPAMATFIRSGTVGYSNPKDPSTWPVHGGMKDLIAKALRDKRAVVTTRVMVVTPNGSFRMGWDLTMMAGLAFVALFTPFQMSFLQEDHDLIYPERWPYFFALDRLIDLMFLCDIVVNFRSGWLSETGAVVFDAWTAARAYLRGWFALDFLSLVPWETLAFFVTLDSSSALRLPKLLKLVRLFKIMKLVRASRVVNRLEQNLGIKNGILRLTKFTVGIIIIAHWLACILMFISTLDTVGSDTEECYMALDGDPLAKPKWRYNLYCGCECDTGMLYVAALYWSVMTITTIGYGDVTPVNLGEMMFMLVGMILGAAVFSFVVGTCCSLIEGLDKVSLEFQAECDSVNDYMEICNIPTRMRRQARSYMATRRVLSSKHNEEHILTLLSPSLRHQFIIHNYSGMVRSVPPLAGAPNSFVVEMASIAEMKLYAPSEAITFQSTKGDPFYSLRHGEVILCRNYCPGLPMQFFDRMRNYGFWNERLLAYDSFTDCSVKAIDFVEALAFDSAGVRAILKRYPQGLLRVKQIVLRRLWKFAASKESIRHAIHALREPAAQTPANSDGSQSTDKDTTSADHDHESDIDVQDLSRGNSFKEDSAAVKPKLPRDKTWSPVTEAEL